MVVAGLAPRQGGRESRPQGDGARRPDVPMPGGMRNADRRTGVGCQPASHLGMVAGEPGELKGSRRVREGARGNGASSPPRLWPTSAAGSRKATGNRDVMAGPSSRPSRITGLCVSVCSAGR